MGSETKLNMQRFKNKADKSSKKSNAPDKFTYFHLVLLTDM